MMWFFKHILLNWIFLYFFVGFCVLTVTSRERQTSGQSGEVCEGGTRRCLRREADCDSDTCVCRGDTFGNGNFACYPSGQVAIEVKNDPMVKTATDENYDLPFSCRYLLSHFKTKFHSRTQFRGHDKSRCEVMVHVTHAKSKGKFYVRSVDVALRISTPITSSPTGEVSYRIEGQAETGQYQFSERAALHFKPHGPFPRDGFTYIYMPGTHVVTKFNPYENRWQLKVDNCGFEIFFRPNDVILNRLQLLVPGVSVRVDNDAEPDWLSQSSVMGLYPGSPTVSYIAQQYNLEQPMAMALRMFTSPVSQTQSNAAPACSAIPHTLQACPKDSARRYAVRQCYFLLTLPRFVRCFDSSTNGENILDLFNKCVAAFCDKSLTQLDAVGQLVRTCQSVNMAVVDNFIKYIELHKYRTKYIFSGFKL